MKKLLLITMLLLLVVPALWAAENIEVSGTGIEAIDGAYVQDGTVDGRPRYVKGDAEIHYFAKGNKWIMYLNENPYFKNNSDSETCPLEGWKKARSLKGQPANLPVLKFVPQQEGN
ncbi:hypothetical protein KAR48_20580 [bacterium]|nr:hypothetical protein [bacterium]